MSKWKTDPLRADLLAVYAEVDRLLAPFFCEGTTECCRFGVTGREPYPTAIELEEVTHALRALGGKTVPSRRALPLAGGEDERPCPLLSEEGRCRIYASRPFGCRTFFCERVQGPGGARAKLPRAEVQRLSRSVADLAARFAPRDPHARPLTRALATLTLARPGQTR
jgi:Fe-S-cluster containining protein